MENFIAGDRVGATDGKLRYSEYGDDEPYYGTITHVLADGRIMVKWDDEYRNKYAKPMSPQKLMFESELSRKYSELEQNFHKVQVEVAEKIKEAGKMILDAQKIAKAAGFNLQDLREAIGPLENAMESAGWQTSSWYC